MKIKFLISILILIISTTAFSKINTDIDIEIEALKATLGNDEDVRVKVSYTNNTNQAIQILRWYLPEKNQPLKENLFEITRDGNPVEYLGRHYKRAAPTKKDYLILAANETISFVVELSSVYDFSEEGAYQLTFSAANDALFSHEEYGAKKSFELSKDVRATEMKSQIPAQIYINKVIDTKAERQQQLNATEDKPSFTISSSSFASSCSNSERSSILSAVSAAKTMANSSVSYLNNARVGSRYTTWFGTATSSRWWQVADNFEAVQDALYNKSITYDCGCNDSAFAYVYPNSPYKIYLCNAFWSAPTSGTDSKGGTIVHELSHFNVVAGTDDIVYGQSGAKNLARSNPSRAIQNADSHEYFAENSPYLN